MPDFLRAALSSASSRPSADISGVLVQQKNTERREGEKGRRKGKEEQGQNRSYLFQALCKDMGILKP